MWLYHQQPEQLYKVPSPINENILPLLLLELLKDQGIYCIVMLRKLKSAPWLMLVIHVLFKGPLLMQWNTSL